MRVQYCTTMTTILETGVFCVFYVIYYNIIQYITIYYSILWYIMIYYNILEDVTKLQYWTTMTTILETSGDAVFCAFYVKYYNILQYVTIYYNILECITKLQYCTTMTWVFFPFLMHSVWRVLRVSGGLNEIFGGPAGALVAGHKVSNWVFMAHPPYPYILGVCGGEEKLCVNRKKSTAPCIPRRSPIQVLTRLNLA